MLKYALAVFLFASPAFSITITGHISPTDNQFATLGSHVYVQLIDSNDAHVNATTWPSPFGYYSFPNALPSHNYFIVVYPGKTPDEWGLVFTPSLRTVLTTSDDLGNMDFTWSPYPICLPDTTCPL